MVNQLQGINHFRLLYRQQVAEGIGVDLGQDPFNLGHEGLAFWREGYRPGTPVCGTALLFHQPQINQLGQPAGDVAGAEIDPLEELILGQRVS